MFLRRMKAKPEQENTSLQRSQSPFGRSTRAPLWTNALPLQPKLTVNQPGDKYEQEADRMAHQVMRTSTPTVQRKGGDVPHTQAPPSVHQALSSSGQPLDTSTRAFMEPRFGQDFSTVRVHTDPQAAQSAADVNARAYTVGQNVIFGAGEYEPGTSEGQKLIAHELTHTVQQKNDSEQVQRLIRTPYPWQGIITPAIGANIRNAPDSSDPANKIGAITQGQTVKVISSTGSWLKVESNFGGPVVTGYVLHSLVDDATSTSMEKSVGTTMVWKPSGPKSGTDFESWASAATETPFPAVTPSTVMNCWEAVLLSAYKSGSLTWTWIHNMYTTVDPANWVSTMSRGARQTYAVPGPNLHMPQRGDLVFFDGIAHVALAVGSGSQVYTFWPPPNTPFTAGGTTDKVKTFTIEDLVNWWKANMPPAPVVEFAAPSW